MLFITKIKAKLNQHKLDKIKKETEFNQKMLDEMEKSIKTMSATLAISEAQTMGEVEEALHEFNLSLKEPY